MKFADHFFEAHVECMNLDCDLFDLLSPLFKDEWLDTMTHDYYDYSIEFKTEQDAVLSQEQIDKLHELGFQRCWLNYPDKTNKFFFLFDYRR